MTEVLIWLACFAAAGPLAYVNYRERQAWMRAHHAAYQQFTVGEARDRDA